MATKTINEAATKEIIAWVEATEMLFSLDCSMPCDEPCENPVICFFIMQAGEDQLGVGATCLPHIGQLAVFGEMVGGDYNRHEKTPVRSGKS